MPRKPNGRILTAKQLSKRAYKVIHLLPRGYRGPALHALLEALADFAATNKKWYIDVNERGLTVGLRKARGAAKTLQ